MRSATRNILLLFVAPAALGAVALILVAFREQLVNPTGNGTGAAAANGPAALVRIQGDVIEPLSPGVMVPLDLEITNPHDFEMSITKLTVAVTEISAPNADAALPCTVADFAVDQAKANLRITLPARATRTLSGLGLPAKSWPHTGMVNRPVNQDGCKEASLTLAYTVSGREGPR